MSLPARSAAPGRAAALAPDTVLPIGSAATRGPAGLLADDPLAPQRARLAERLLRHGRGPDEDPATAVPGLMAVRLPAGVGMICAVYEPLVALVVQGSKRATFGDETLVYGPQRYFVTSLDLPARATVMDATPERPFLSLALRLDMREIATLVLEGVVPPAAPAGGERRAMATGMVDAPLLDAFDRLLALLDAPAHVPVMAPLIRREITYRLLTGEAGWRLRQIAAVDSQGYQVSRAIAVLRGRYAEPLRIEVLARAAVMSVSSFHHHFKALTGMSPLQFQKQLRLGEARRLMLVEHLDAAAAAFRVGYESASQFSREYARQFGAPPLRDISALRLRGTAPQALP